MATMFILHAFPFVSPALFLDLVSYEAAAELSQHQSAVMGAKTALKIDQRKTGRG